MQLVVFRNKLFNSLNVILLFEFIDSVKTTVYLVELSWVEINRFQQTANFLTDVLQVDIAAVDTLDKLAYLWVY